MATPLIDWETFAVTIIMTTQSYTPGHTTNATTFMAGRSLESHATFFTPYLNAGVSVLDCGCGPGSITLGIAGLVAPGQVVGVDFATSQIEAARHFAILAGIVNVAFQAADCGSLPFEDHMYDRVFSHALLEHVSSPEVVLREMYRVTKPGGIIGVCSPDWGGFVVAPSSPQLANAIEAYVELQTRNGGDVKVGRRLGELLAQAGFSRIKLAARYECYSTLTSIGEYLAIQLERDGDLPSAQVFRQWSTSDRGMFAQTWVAAIGHKE